MADETPPFDQATWTLVYTTYAYASAKATGEMIARYLDAKHYDEEPVFEGFFRKRLETLANDMADEAGPSIRAALEISRAAETKAPPAPPFPFPPSGDGAPPDTP